MGRWTAPASIGAVWAAIRMIFTIGIDADGVVLSRCRSWIRLRPDPFLSISRT